MSRPSASRIRAIAFGLAFAAAHGSCCQGVYYPGSDQGCPEVLYEPVGELVHDPEDCGADTCPLYCDEGVCGKGNSRGYWCEPCERVDAYLAGDGSVCWVVWDDDGSTNVFCGG